MTNSELTAAVVAKFKNYQHGFGERPVLRVVGNRVAIYRTSYYSNEIKYKANPGEEMRVLEVVPNEKGKQYIKVDCGNLEGYMSLGSPSYELV